MAEGAGGGGPRFSLDVSRIQALLAQAGVASYEPRVLGLLLEVAHAATHRLLVASKNISVHCQKGAVDEGDVQVALEFTGMLGRESTERDRLLRLSAEKNSQPLPSIRNNVGLKLPNDRFCLLQRNVEWVGPDGQPPPATAPHSFPSALGPARQQVRAEHVINILKRPAQDDYD